MHPKSDKSLFVAASLLILSLLLVDCPVNAFAAVNRQFCETSSDCGENQCCADTPIGYKLCLDYEKQGELCFFRSRTPTCGCARGLRCVSTMPMEPGEYGHDYSCAPLRPFMYYKLMPYLNDANDIE